jgi:hypothetical protein
MGLQLILRRFAGVCVEWIILAQDFKQLRALVIAVMNLRVLPPRK